MVEVVVWLAEHCGFSDQKRAGLPLPPHSFWATRVGVTVAILCINMILSGSIRYFGANLSYLSG